MDQVLIQLATKELEAVASDLIQAGHLDVRAFYASLLPLLTRAKHGEIAEPLEWRDIPGGYAFSDGDLRKHTALESAFAKFRLAVTGPGP